MVRGSTWAAVEIGKEKGPSPLGKLTAYPLTPGCRNQQASWGGWGILTTGWGQRSCGDSPVLPVDDVGRALHLGAAVIRAPRVDYELDMPAPELALRGIRGVP